MTVKHIKIPHVHAEIIKAWADGEEIEYWNGASETDIGGKWLTVRLPSWNHNMKYRVKPKLPTLGEIAKAASVEYWNNRNKYFTHNKGQDWQAIAQAVKTAVESGEYSE